MTPETVVQIVLELFTSGTAFAVLRGIAGILTRRKNGQAIREPLRRDQIVRDRDKALAETARMTDYAHTLREVCLVHGIPLTDLPPWPRKDT